jgi:RNA polymerase sigma-70 factor (ECF subfamily)
MAGDDGALWSRMQESDPQALGELFQRHAVAVRAFCARRTSSVSLADDLTTVVFMEAWRRRKDAHLVGGNALPWLLGIASNCARNAQRSLRRYRLSLSRLPRPRPTESSEEEAIKRLEVDLGLKAAAEYLAVLSPREREAFMLVHWSGLSYDETAAALSVPIGTVRSRVARAHKKLRAHKNPGLFLRSENKEALS